MKVFTQNLNTIKSTYDCRLSPAYYAIFNAFNNIKRKGFNVYDINAICYEPDSGKYIDGYTNDGIKYIRVSNIKKYSIDNSEIKFVNKKSNIKILNENDIVFGRTQATISKLGTFAIISDAQSATSQHVARISSKDKTSNYYLVAYLNSKFGKAQMALASYGDTRVEFTHNQIKEMKVIVFDEIINKIEKNTKLIQEFAQKAQEYFKDAQDIIDLKIRDFNSKTSKTTQCFKSVLLENDIWNASCYRDEYLAIFNGIKNNYKYSYLSELIYPIKKGIEVGSINYRLEIEKENSFLPFIRTSDIYNNEIDLYPDYYFDMQLQGYIGYIPSLKINDIIFSKDGKINQVGIVDRENEFIPCSGFSILRVKENIVSANYLFAILSHKKLMGYQANMRTVIASTIPHLKPNRIEKFLIPIFEDDIIKKIEEKIKLFRKCIIEKNKLMKDNEDTFNSYYKKLFA